MLYTVTNGEPRRVSQKHYSHEGVTHDVRAVGRAWSDEELAAIGLYRAHRENTPDGMVETGRELVFEDDKVISRPTYRPLSPQEIEARIAAAIDEHVEAQAQSMQYNSAAHLAGYATSTVPEWQAEAQAFVAWRDAVWTAALEMLETADPAAPPTAEDVIAALPEWTLP